MPIPKIADFLTEPEHKEQRDFMQGVIDARVKEIIAQRIEEKKKKGGGKGKGSNEESGSIFDDLFGTSDEE